MTTVGVGKHPNPHAGAVQPGKGFRAQGFLTGRDTAKAIFHELYAADENAGKKAPSAEKKKKKADKKDNEAKKEPATDNITFLPPNIELPDNASAFGIFAAVRQCILEREGRERALILSCAVDGTAEDGGGDGEQKEEDKLSPLPKVVGLGLRSVFELIRQTRASHPEFCARALQALLDILQGQTPEGLSKEPDDILGSLFDLLMDLATGPASDDTNSLTTLSSACLLSLMVAMGNTGKLLTGISSLLMIAGQRSLQALLVPDIVVALQRSVQALLVGRTQFPDWLNLGVPGQSLIDTWSILGLSPEASNATGFSAIASDGRYLYIHGDKGLLKLGSGYSGTIKGHVYATNESFYPGERGWLGFTRSQLLFKCQEGNEAARNILVKVGTDDLQEQGQLAMPTLADTGTGLFFSDGVNLGILSSVTDDTFVVHTLGSLSAFSVGIGGELQAKLARKCLMAYGEPMPGGDKDSKDSEEIDPGEEIAMVGAGKDFSFLRSSSGKVYFMGKSQSLGIKQSSVQGSSKWTELPISRSPRIVQSSLGHDGHNVIMLTDDGSTYFAGTARKGEDGDQVKGRRQMKPSKPVKMLRLEGKFAVHSACNNGTTAIVTREGELYLYGKDYQNTDTTTGLVTELKGTHIKEVALGKAHACALTSTGQLYTFGISNKGQCGRGNITGQPVKEGAMSEGMPIATEEDADDEEVEKEEDACAHDWVTDQCMICTTCGECTGYGASCIRSQRPGRRPGMICGCGSGDAGCSKCGTCRACSGDGGQGGQGNNAPAPENNQGNNRVRGREGGGGGGGAGGGGAGAGGGANVMMGNGAPNDWLGHLRDAFIRRKVHHRQLDWVLGKDKAKDEGSNSGDDREPERDLGKHVIHPPGMVTIGTGQSPVRQMACGLHHSVVLLENGEAYVFGLGNHGQLGQRDSANRSTPVKLAIEEKVTQVAAGSNHTVVLSESGRVYTCGSFQKGQLCRPVQEENNAAGSTSHTTPAPIPSLGARYSRRATWVGASGDHTFVKIDEALINPKMLGDSLVFADQGAIGILPNEENVSSVKCLMLNRKDGSCTSFTTPDQTSFKGCSVCLDPLYRVLWSYNPLLHQIQCYNILKTGMPCPALTELPKAACILSPQLALPCTPRISMEGSHIALHILACLDSLTASQEAGMRILEADTQVQSVAKVYTKEDFSVVNRFEGYGGGWGYSGHSVEAVRFCPDADVLLGGFGLFGGRGEYSAKIKVYDLGPKGGEYELDGELLAESDDVTFDCGAREKFPILFEEPVALTAGTWYVAWARVNGPSSDCGSSGQGTVTTEDQVSFQFMSSKKSNNGTDINAGQIPQILYRLPQPDSDNFRSKSSHGEPVHVLSTSFSSSVSPEVFESLLKLLRWSWNMLSQKVRDSTTATPPDPAENSECNDLGRLVYIASACLRLLRCHVCEIYPNPGTGKQPTGRSSQLPECISMTCDLLKHILGELDELQRHWVLDEISRPPPTRLRGSPHPAGRPFGSLVEECHHTFVQCFHAFYPTPQLKWVFLCSLLSSAEDTPGLVSQSHLLAAVLEALCDPTVKLTRVLPILRDGGHPDPSDPAVGGVAHHHHHPPPPPVAPFAKQLSMEDSPSAAQAEARAQFPELVVHMEDRVQDGGIVALNTSFQEILDKLLLIMTSPVREALDKKQQCTASPLVKNASRLLTCIVSELSAMACINETDNQTSGRPLLMSSSRFTRVSQNRGWSTGNGTPDAICFSVDKPGILIAGFCVYGGVGYYNYELELLDGSEVGPDGHSQRWNSLELVKGSYGHLDLAKDIAEVKFDRPVAIKEGVKYAVRLRNHGNRTVNGDGGMTHVKCPDGVTFSFSLCRLSSNGTSQTRGQIPQILYYNTAAESESLRVEPKSQVLEQQARINVLSIVTTIIKAASDLLMRAEGCHDLEIPSTFTSSHMFSHLLPLTLAYIGPVTSADPKSAVQVLDLLKDLLPPVAAINQQFAPPTPPVNQSTDSYNGQSADIHAITTSVHYAVVESDHPYKAATVANYKVSFQDSVQWMLLQFDPQCGTVQPEDSLQIYIPTNAPRPSPHPQPAPSSQQTSTASNNPSPTSSLASAAPTHTNAPTVAATGEGGVPASHSWPVLKKFHGKDNWPQSAVVLPGNEVSFVLGTASDYVKDEKANMFGFKCTIIGYEWTPVCDEGLVNLEKEVAYLGGMCAASLMKKDISLPAASTERGYDEVELITEAAEEIFSSHASLLCRGFALAHPPTIHQALEGNLPLSTQSNERSFLRDFVMCAPGTSGGRLARWLQPESYVEPRQCDLIFTRDEIRCSVPTTVTVHSRDQYGGLVFVPSLKIEVEAVPVGKRDNPYQASKFQKASGSGDKDMTFGGHKAPTFDTPFEPVTRREVSVYNSITMMKEYEGYSFEELRFASLPVTRPNESMLVRDNADGSYTANWTPSSIGLYSIHVTIDGHCLEDVPQVEVNEPPHGVLPPNVTPKKTCPPVSKMRKLIAKYCRGLRIRSAPSLQSEQIGILDVGGVIIFTEELQNDDGIWVRLTQDSIRKYCPDNGHREGWCLLFNQHIGKTFLFPVEEPKSIYDDRPERRESPAVNSSKSFPLEPESPTLAKPKTGGPGMYQVVNCGPSGHNIRCRASLKATPIGMMVMGNQAVIIQEVRLGDGSIWVKLDKASMNRYCENTKGEAWALSYSKGVTYLMHENDLSLADKEKAKSSSETLSFYNSQMGLNGASGFDFKNAQGPPALRFAHTGDLVPFMFGGGVPGEGPTSPVENGQVYDENGEPAEIFNHFPLSNHVDEAGNNVSPKEKETLDCAKEALEIIRESRSEQKKEARTDSQTSDTGSGSGSGADVKNVDGMANAVESELALMTAASNNQPASAMPVGSPQRSRFSIGSGQQSPKSSMSPKPGRKSRSPFGRRDRTLSPSSKDRSPARFRASALKQEAAKEIAQTAIATSVAECVRCVFAAFLWHEGLVHDAMACASFLKFNPGMTKQSTFSPQEQITSQNKRDLKLKNRHSMDLSKSMTEGMFFSGTEFSAQDHPMNQNEMSNSLLSEKLADESKKSGEGTSAAAGVASSEPGTKSFSSVPSTGPENDAKSAVKASAFLPPASPKHSPKQASKSSQDGAQQSPLAKKLQPSPKKTLSATEKDADFSKIRERSATVGAEYLNKASQKDTASKPSESESKMSLPVTLKHLLTFWDELTSTTINIASQQVLLPSPAPITKTKSKVEKKEERPARESKGKKRREKYFRGGQGNLFGEAAGVQARMGDFDTICDLCLGVFPHPVTYHMRQMHPGCGKTAWGHGYNSSGVYRNGFVGNCGEGGTVGRDWYLMCERCREKYFHDAEDKNKDKAKKIRKKVPSLKTPRVLPPLEAHHVMKANAMFLLDLASATGSMFPSSSPLRKITRFDLPTVSESESLMTQFPDTAFRFLSMMVGQGSPEEFSEMEDVISNSSGPFMGFPSAGIFAGQDNHSSAYPQSSGHPKLLSSGSLDHTRRVNYFRSMSMNASSYAAAHSESRVKVRRRNNSGSSDGSSLLRRPSALLARLIEGRTLGLSALHRPVMLFIAQRHDLDGLRLAMKQALRKGACRVYAMQALNWLLRNVTQLTCLHDLLWHFVSALTPAPGDKETEEEGDKDKDKEEKKEKKEQEQELDGLMCEHPLADITIAGEAIQPLPATFHTLLQTVASAMMHLPTGGALQQMAMRCWCLRFRPADHFFLHRSQVFSNINQILSKSDESEGDGEGSVTGSVASVTESSVTSQGPVRVELLRDITNSVELQVSSRAAMLPSLTDGSTETFWESGDEDRNRNKYVTLSSGKGMALRMVAVHVDNSRDLGNKVTTMTFLTGSSADNLQKVQLSSLDTRHTGWVTCDLGSSPEGSRVVRIELKGPDSHLRLRQVKALGGSKGETLAASAQPSALGLQQQNCVGETLRVFRLLTSQVFGRLLSDEEPLKDGQLMKPGDMHTPEDEETNDSDLKEHMVGILFSRPKLTNLQKQVCSHIVQAIRKETVKMQDEWEAGLASTSRLTPSSTPSSSAPSTATTMDPSASVPDAYCFELLSMVLALSGSRVGRSYVAQQDGLLLDLVSLLHTGTPRIQRQVTAVLRRFLLEIHPKLFMQIMGVTGLPPEDLSLLTQEMAHRNLDTPAEDNVGVLDVFLACIAKALTVQTKVKGGWQAAPGRGGAAELGMGRGTHSYTLARLQQQHCTEESPVKRSRSKHWWLCGSMSHNIAEQIIALIKDLSAGKISTDWAKVTKGAIAERVLSLTKLDEGKRAPSTCIKTNTLWLSLASLCVLENEHVERLSSSQWAQGRDSPAAKQKQPTCDNHDDGETSAIIQCEHCGNLCADCDRVLHLPKKSRNHQRKVFKEEEESIRVDLHEGCGRSKLFWVMTLADSKTLKAMVEFKETTPGNASGSGGSSVAMGTCRFCSSKTSTGLLGPAGSVCSDPDCQRYAENACTKVQSCGHMCGGIRDEADCLPCLHGCNTTSSLRQDADDMCMICFTEALACAPAIQLNCGHVFHHHCCRAVLERKWVGPRITFGFSLCPICKMSMKHKCLQDVLKPIEVLHEDVRRKALMRLEYEGLLKSEAITSSGARFFNDPAGFAMNRYAYYVCFKCKKAYYGGEARCDQEAGIQEEYDPSELVCGGCSDVSRAQMCSKHGTDFLEYKCRYCCSVAVFFCFGSTHFCQACHDDFQSITTIPKAELPHCPAGARAKQLEGDECPLHVQHPPTGEEFALGCGVCRNAHTF